MKPKALETTKSMKDIDFILLSYLYLYRALEMTQIFKYVYKLNKPALSRRPTGLFNLIFNARF